MATLAGISTTACAGHSCVRMDNGSLRGWGGNQTGEPDRGFISDYEAPARVGGDNTYVAVSTGGLHTCGLTGVGAVLCWGANWADSSGTGPPMHPPIPSP